MTTTAPFPKSSEKPAANAGFLFALIASKSEWTFDARHKQRDPCAGETLWECSFGEQIRQVNPLLDDPPHPMYDFHTIRRLIFKQGLV